MNLKKTSKRWTPDDRQIVFDFEIFFDDQREISEVSVKIYWWNLPEGFCTLTILSRSNHSDSIGKVDLTHRFDNGVYLEGYLKCIAMDSDNSDAGIWGDFHYGVYKEHHFEGIMIELETYFPVRPPPPPIPGRPTAIQKEIIAGSGDQRDLFPYIYMRRWPKISDEDLQDSFVRYKKPSLKPPVSSPPDSNPFASNLPSESLYDRLCKSASRERMESLAVQYIEGKQFITSVDSLKGAIKYFAEIDAAIPGPTYKDLAELISLIERTLSKEKSEIKAYLNSQDYLAEKDGVWQSYFALIIVLGYHVGLLEELTRTLVMANLVEEVLFDDKMVTKPERIQRLGNATIILPSQIFPLPSKMMSPPLSPHCSPTGWIEPYAIGDLQMVRQRLVRYEPGEIAYMVNILRGERKEIKRRDVDKVNESLRIENNDDEVLENNAQENRTNLLSETRKMIGVKTNFDNFKTTYGPPTTAALSGGWKMGNPQKENSTGFAREILTTTANRIAHRVSQSRIFTTLNESEETETSVFDNTGSDQNTRGIYRWLNKIYAVCVVNYGTRLIVEFMLKDPALKFIEAESELHGLSFYEPLSPAKLGITSYESIDQNTYDYAKWAAKYEVAEILPPPLASRIVSAALQGEQEKQIAIPQGYMATDAYVACTFPEGANNIKLDGLVGRHSFSFGRPQTEIKHFKMQNEDATVPVALMGNIVPSSPPAAPNNYLVTVEIECAPTITTINEWKIKTYNAITRGYNAQKTAYYERAGARKRVKGQSRSPFANRRIERRELKHDCIRLLLERYCRLVGYSDQFFRTESPPQFSVNEPRYIQFFEQVFEWNEMAYSFSTGGLKNGRDKQIMVRADLDEYTGNDSLFTKFLQADLARIIVPVNPNYTMAALYFLSSGMIWSGDNMLAPVNKQDVAVVNELKIAGEHGETEPDGWSESESWEVTIPTSMHILQDSQELPSFRSDGP